MRKLKLLLMAFALLVGGGNSSWAYQTPVADGIYYLYNTGVTDGGSGFISRGEDYAQRAVIDKYGIPFKLISTGSADTYYFQLYDTDLWLSDNGFMYTDGDEGRRRAIKVVLQNDGIYKLINTSNTDIENAEVENWYGHPVGDGTGNRRNYLWQFLSVVEYEAVVAGYTATDKANIASTMGWDLSGTNFDSYLSTNYVGVDKTSLIEHATFDTSHSTTGWAVTANTGSSMALGWGNESGDKITPEVYQGYGTISQTVTVPNAGLYKVSVNAFARNINYERFHEAGAVSSVSYLKANDNKVRLCDIYSNGEVTSGFPGGPNAANTNFFSKGNYLNEVYVYVDDSKQITITLCNPSATGGCWMVFNNFKLTYYSDQVSSDDATAILATAAEKESKAMLASVKTALTSAKNTFDGARTIANYNALSTAIDNANSSIAAYAPLGTKLTEAASVKSSVSGNSTSYVTTFDTNIAAITSEYNAGNIAESEISTQVAAVETEIIKLVKSQTVAGSDMTRAVPNASCDGAAGNDNWKIKNDLASGENFRLDTWAGDASGMSVPMIEYWITNGNNLSSNEIYQTITGLSDGMYQVTAETAVNNESNVAPNAGSALLFANDATTDITTSGTETSFKGQTGTFSVVGVVSDGSLTFGLKAVSPNYNWIAFKNVHLYYMGTDVATSADYTALQDAIDAYDAAKWGFEAGEYAPYNNVEAMENITAAKAIDPDAVNSKLLVNSLTTKITLSAANAAEVNAFYDGDFSECDEDNTSPLDYTPAGWTASENMRMMLKNSETYPGLSDASATIAMMSWSGGITYGETVGYEMPLKANTFYTLKFKAAGWNNEDRSGISVSILKGEDGMALYNLGTPDRDIKGNENNTVGMTSYEYVFATGAAGNYVFHIQSGHNMVITDFEIKKSATESITITAAGYATYASDNALDFSKLEDLTAYKATVSGSTVVLSPVTAVPAGAGVVLKGAAKTYDVPVMTGAASLEDNALIRGNDAAVPTEADGYKNYVLSTDDNDENVGFYLANGETVPTYRAYLQTSTGAGARLTIVFEDEATGISTLKNADFKVEGYFDLQGRRVENPTKGLYIKDGKVVSVK